MRYSSLTSKVPQNLLKAAFRVNGQCLVGTASQDFISSFTGRGAWRGRGVSILGDNSKPSRTEPKWSPLLSLLCDSKSQRFLPDSQAFAGASDAAFGQKHFCPCIRKKLEVLKLNLAEMTLKTLI